jgi:hypothetical protein
MEQERGDGRPGLPEAIGPAVQEAAAYAERKKAQGAARIDSVADAVHRAASEMESKMPTAAHYVHEAAAGLEQASAVLRNRRIEDLARSIEKFARERPAAFLGGAVLAGFALSRFLKSSASRDGLRSEHRPQPGL